MYLGAADFRVSTKRFGPSREGLMPHRYAEFVHLENIKHFEKRLESETDPAVRTTLLQLLDEERTKLVQIGAATRRADKLSLSRG